MSRYELGDAVRFRTVASTIELDVDGERGVVVAVRNGRPVVSVGIVEVLASDDELDLED